MCIKKDKRRIKSLASEIILDPTALFYILSGRTNKTERIMELQQVLDIEFKATDLDRKITIQGYLGQLLYDLWKEGESFNGKRPFGNSGWQWDVYKALIVGGAIEGKLDSCEYVEEIDTVKADKLIGWCIEYIFLAAESKE